MRRVMVALALVAGCGDDEGEDPQFPSGFEDAVPVDAFEQTSCETHEDPYEVSTSTGPGRLTVDIKGLDADCELPLAAFHVTTSEGTRLLIRPEDMGADRPNCLCRYDLSIDVLGTDDPDGLGIYTQTAGAPDAAAVRFFPF